MTHQPQQVLDQEDMFQKPVLYHLDMLIFPDGLCRRQEELRMSVEDQIEIKHMIQDQLLVVKLILKIKQVQNVTLGQATDFKETRQGHLKIKCKEDSVSNSLMLNGESTNNIIVTLSTSINYKL